MNTGRKNSKPNIGIHGRVCVSEEGGDGEGVDLEEPSLPSYTLRYVSLAELGTLCRVGLREPMHLCAYMDRGEDADSEAPSLLSYTLSRLTGKLKFVW